MVDVLDRGPCFASHCRVWALTVSDIFTSVDEALR